MTQATSTSSSLLAQLTPMLSDRAVIMVVSNVDDPHLDGIGDSPAHDQLQQTRHRLQVWIFAGRSSALVR